MCLHAPYAKNVHQFWIINGRQSDGAHQHEYDVHCFHWFVSLCSASGKEFPWWQYICFVFVSIYNVHNERMHLPEGQTKHCTCTECFVIATSPTLCAILPKFNTFHFAWMKLPRIYLIPIECTRNNNDDSSECGNSSTYEHWAKSAPTIRLHCA